MNWVAYSPNLAIRNSNFAIFKIYFLKNRLINKVFKVEQQIKL